MMPDLPWGWHLAVLLLSLGGLALLALASEREGELLLRRSVPLAHRRLLRCLGWPLLASALAVCVGGWFGHFGTVLWLGWLSVAAVALVFGIAYVPWRDEPAGRRVRNALETIAARACCTSAGGRLGLYFLWVLLVLSPLAFAWALWQAPVHPLRRADAVQGPVGPWTYRLAEEVQAAPEVLASGAAVKHFVLQLQGDELAVARAWLRVQPPRSPRTAGMAFEGHHADREAMIAIPPSATAQDAFWLTVQGKDGQLHHAEIGMRRLSPATADFVEGRR